MITRKRYNNDNNGFFYKYKNARLVVIKIKDGSKIQFKILHKEEGRVVSVEEKRGVHLTGIAISVDAMACIKDAFENWDKLNIANE